MSTNTDKLRQHYLTMPHYHFDMTIDDYHFSDKEQADIANYLLLIDTRH